MVPVNASLELTNLPLSLYTNAEDFDSLQQPPTFISNCVICDESFSSQEESDAHFGSEDHETAQVTATHIRLYQMSDGLRITIDISDGFRITIVLLIRFRNDNLRPNNFIFFLYFSSFHSRS